MLSHALTSPLWQHTIAASFLIALLSSPAQATEILAVTDARHPMQNLGKTRLIEPLAPLAWAAETTLPLSLPG